MPSQGTEPIARLGSNAHASFGDGLLDAVLLLLLLVDWLLLNRLDRPRRARARARLRRRMLGDDRLVRVGLDGHAAAYWNCRQGARLAVRHSPAAHRPGAAGSQADRRPAAGG